MFEIIINWDFFEILEFKLRCQRIKLKGRSLLAVRHSSDWLDEAATRSGCAATAVGEFVSCRLMPQLWGM